MKLPRESVEEYQRIYKKVFKRDISYEEAEKQEINLLQVMMIVMRPLPGKEPGKPK